MDEEIDKLELKIERCRRLKSWMTDDEVRDALEQLACEYEAKLPRKPRQQQQQQRFMLRPEDREG